MTKEELVPNAVQFFEKNPECHEMLATTDGNFFDVGPRAHYAASHASTLADKEIYHITRAEAGVSAVKEESIEETVEEPEETAEETADGLSPEDVTKEDAAAYKEATGKAAVWHSKATGGFIAWKESN